MGAVFRRWLSVFFLTVLCLWGTTAHTAILQTAVFVVPRAGDVISYQCGTGSYTQYSVSSLSEACDGYAKKCACHV